MLMTAVGEATAAKSRACPLACGIIWPDASSAPETMEPELSTVIVPLAMLVLILNASLLVAIKSASARLTNVKLPVVNEPEVSMPRVVALMIPELSMTTPGLVDPPAQTIAVAAAKVPPAAMVPVSLLLTVLGATSATPFPTEKEGMSAPYLHEESAARRLVLPRARAHRSPHFFDTLLHREDAGSDIHKIIITTEHCR